MARLFTAASSEKITLGLGGLGFAFGPGTIAMIVRTPASFASAFIFSAGATSVVSYILGVGAAATLALRLNGTSAASVSTLATSKWYLVAGTKATGTVAPRLHWYDYAANTWVHENSGTSVANSSIPITRAAFGVDSVGTATFWNSDIAAGGVWNVVLTDSQVESLVSDPTITNWRTASGSAAACKGMWRLDQDVVTELVTDLSGGGATETARTGTTVTIDDFPLFDPTVRSKIASPSWAA